MWHQGTRPDGTPLGKVPPPYGGTPEHALATLREAVAIHNRCDRDPENRMSARYDVCDAAVDYVTALDREAKPVISPQEEPPKGVGGFVEPVITVNGCSLNSAQAMAVRVALQDLATSLKANGLGDDEHGRQMTGHYLERIQEINRFIFVADQGLPAEPESRDPGANPIA